MDHAEQLDAVTGAALRAVVRALLTIVGVPEAIVPSASRTGLVLAVQELCRETQGEQYLVPSTLRSFRRFHSHGCIHVKPLSLRLEFSIVSALDWMASVLRMRLEYLYFPYL
jgi:hypothetical protein